MSCDSCIDNAAPSSVKSIFSVEPFKPVCLLKGYAGYRTNEFYELKEVYNFDWPHTYDVEHKYDGFRLQSHKKGDKVKIYSIRGETDVTSRFPKIVEQIKALSVDSVVLDHESVAWSGKILEGEPLRREYMAEYIHGKMKVDDSKVTLFIFDILYYNGEDLHTKKLTERKEFLHKLLSTGTHPNLIDVETNYVNSPKEMREAILKVSKEIGSEGAMIKDADSTYPLNCITNKWSKFKKEMDVDVQVIEILKRANGYSYVCGFGNPNELTPVGQTYVTKLKAEVGDIIRVSITRMLRKDDEYSWSNPVVVEKRIDKFEPDSVAFVNSLSRIVTEHPEISEESWLNLTSDYETYFARYDPYMDIATCKPCRFVLQTHQRGDTLHHDLRFQTTEDSLRGWTLNDPGNIDLPSKISNKPGMDNFKILAEQKAQQPAEWMDVEGVAPIGEPGSTKELPGIFTIIDKGTYIQGAQKPDFHEYFIYGEKFDGRFVVRKVKNRPEWKKARGKKSEMTPYIWFFWKPLDQSPYAVSKDAKDKHWYPPPGVVPIPEEWIEKNRAKFDEWHERAKLVWAKVEGRNHIDNESSEELKIKGIPWKESDECEMNKCRFSIQKVWGEKSEKIEFNMRFELNTSKHMKFIFEKDPLETDNIESPEPSIIDDNSWLHKRGELKPGQEGNDLNESIFIDILDNGFYSFYEHTDKFISMKLFGKRLRGYFILNKIGNRWYFSRSSLPKTAKYNYINRFD